MSDNKTSNSELLEQTLQDMTLLCDKIEKKIIFQKNIIILLIILLSFSWCFLISR